MEKTVKHDVDAVRSEKQKCEYISDLGCYVGRIEYTIDSKGYLMCPSVVYNTLNKNDNEQVLYLVINAAPKQCDRCVLAMTEPQFSVYCERIKTIPKNSPAYKIVRQVLMNVAKVTINAQQKFLIPDYLQEYAGMNGEDKKVVVRMTDTNVELWSSSRLMSQLNEDLADISATDLFAAAIEGTDDSQTDEQLDREYVTLRKRIRNKEAENAYRALMNGEISTAPDLGDDDVE